VNTELTRTVSDFFARHSLSGRSGIVALSGGPDSVCLACLMRNLLSQGCLSKLVFAHLNHQLRGDESDADEAFVVGMAGEWGLPCRTHRLDVAALAQAADDNLEATARRLRYDWLTQIAQEEEAVWIATGHSADDQAETVLFRLLRGTGLQGLAGMRERRPLAEGIDLVRPLLTVRRDDIMTFLQQHRQDFRDDASNQDRRFNRNRLRHELLPLLAKQYNAAITNILCRLANQARDVQTEILLQANDLLAKAELPPAGSIIVLHAATLAQSSCHVRRETFRLVWQRQQWPMGQMTFEAWDRLAQLVDEAKGMFDLPDGISARRVGQVVRLEQRI
jgi:tRNA(Ile)-lysidine synthase